MVRKINTLFILLLILVLIACKKNKITGPEKLPQEEQLELFHEQITAIMADLTIKKYSYALFSNKEIIRLEEHGISNNQSIPIAEISNLFLSTILLQLADKGLVSIRDYVSEYGIDDPQLKNVKIKDLLSHTSEGDPGTQYHFNQQRFELLHKVIEVASGKEFPDLLKSSLTRQFGMKETQCAVNKNNSNECYSTLSDLIKFSMAVDNHELFKKEDTHELMLRPVYLKNGWRTPSALGCFIQFHANNKFVWSCGEKEGYSSLIIKSVNDSLSFIILAEKEQLHTPFNPEREDLWSSLIATSFLKSIIINNDTINAINYYAPINICIKNAETIAGSKYRDLIVKEITTYIKLYHSSGKTDQYEKLIKIYNAVFPNDMPVNLIVSEPLALINEVSDYIQITKSFTIQEDTVVTVFATGEFTSELTLSPWEYDNVEIFFDLNHEKSPGFQSNNDDRQYRFNYDYPVITGSAPSLENITLCQHDKSPTQWNFEIAIPWLTLFNSDSIIPEPEQIFGFDIAIADNDNIQREGSLAWQSKLNDSPWSNTSTYGTMKLVKTAGAKDDTICYSIAASDQIKLDGQSKNEWNGVPRYPIDKEFMEGITGPDDQSGWFRTQWDNENLYFLIEVTDDYKRLLDKTGDFGWIENASRDTVWIMSQEETMHAGGDNDNRYIHTKIPLKAGDYTLNYVSNQTHSYNRWTKERPEITFYGIAVYE